MKMFIVTYKKHFVSGNLEGLSVDEYFRTTGDALAIHLAYLNGATKAHPTKDLIGNRFYVSDVKHKEIS